MSQEPTPRPALASETCASHSLLFAPAVPSRWACTRQDSMDEVILLRARPGVKNVRNRPQVSGWTTRQLVLLLCRSGDYGSSRSFLLCHERAVPTGPTPGAYGTCAQPPKPAIFASMRVHRFCASSCATV